MSVFLATSYQCEGSLVWITLDRPRGNVFTIEVMRALTEAIRNLQGDTQIKCIAFSTEGKHFSFGAEVAEHKREVIGEALAALRELIMTIADSAMPVAMLVQGMCLGGAFEVVMAAHMIFASEDARFGLPEITLGVFPPAGSVLLPRRLAQGVCDQITLGGEPLPAQRLYELGFLTSVSNGEALPADFEAWFASTLGKYSAATIRHTTRASRRIFLQGLEADLQAAEKSYTEELMATHDANEGIAAFLEKRQPTWRDA